MKDNSIVEPLPVKPQSITRVPTIPSPDPAAPRAPSPTDEKIEIWFAKHFHGLGQILDERLYNLIHAAKEDLKAELRS